MRIVQRIHPQRSSREQDETDVSPGLQGIAIIPDSGASGMDHQRTRKDESWMPSIARGTGLNVMLWGTSHTRPGVDRKLH